MTTRRQQAAALESAAARRAARRRRVWIVATGVTSLAAVGLTVAWALRPGPPLPGAFSAISDTLKDAGCTDPETRKEADRAHLFAGDEQDYPTTPPVSGAHAPAPLPSSPAVHSEQPAEESLVHNLEHGYLVVWYDETLPAAELEALKARVRGERKILLTPITYAALSKGRHVAYTAWRRLLLCESHDDAVLQAVIDEWRERDSLAPEPDGA